jgi:branched-subunit amino acid ABC-type transport system permease component
LMSADYKSDCLVIMVLVLLFKPQGLFRGAVNRLNLDIKNWN